MPEYDMHAEMRDADDVLLVLDQPTVGYGFPISRDEDGELIEEDFDMVYAITLRVGTMNDLQEAREAGADMDLKDMIFLIGRDELEALGQTTMYVLDQKPPERS